MKSFAISFDVEISRVARMSAQMQDIFILPAPFFICQIKSLAWRDSRER